MKFRPFFILLFLFCLGSETVRGQQSHEISGYVIDQETGEPVPYASVGIPEQNRGISANVNGFFRLIVPEKNLGHHLQISSIGYQRLVTPFTEIDWDNEQRYYLQPEATLLEEIVILGKSETLEELVKRVSKGRKHFLRSKPYLMNGFYKEALKIDGNYQGYTEAQGMLYLNGYDAGYKNSRHHVTYDLAQWKHLRRSNYPDSNRSYLEIATLLRAKDFYLHDGPLSRANLSKLAFSITDSTVYQERLVLEISFEPKEDYREVLNYKGRMYVTEDDQALLQLAIVSQGGEPYLKQPETMGVTGSFEINFFQFEDQYYLGRVSLNRSYSHSNQDVNWFTELVGASFSGQEAMFLTYNQRVVLYSEMLNPLVNYDQSFWDSFSFSNGAEAREMIESYSDLNDQFKDHHNQRLVPLPEGFDNYTQMANERNALDFLMQR